MIRSVGQAGLAGYIVKTTDAGDNWNLELQSPGIHGIDFVDALNGWVLKNGAPFKTTDGGESWTEITSFPASDSWDAFFIDSINGFISRSNGLFKTSDGGANWEITGVTDFLYGRFSNLKDNLFMAGVPRTYNSINLGESWDEIMDLRDKSIRYIRLSEINRGYAVGDNGLIIRYLDSLITPVELNSFKGSINNSNHILLEWATATETNNKGFEVQRSEIRDQKSGSGDYNGWKRIGFVEGNGTTTQIHIYSFSDLNVIPGIYKYRLKQIDFDGSYNLSKEVEVKVTAPSKFRLEPNYPNPFNPVTTISFEVPEKTQIELVVYDILGRKIKSLVDNEVRNPGRYEMSFNGNSLGSGVYIYRLVAKNYSMTRKMLLMK